MAEFPRRTTLVAAGPLDIAVEESGPPDGWPVILLHGFPYDPRAFDTVIPALAATGVRVIVPYLRGYGATRFRDAGAMRSGQQAAVGDDLHRLIDALDVHPVVVGFDWGGRAACVAAALWPAEVRGLVAIGGYLIQDLADSRKPVPILVEHLAWHQFYLASDRGRRALVERREELCRYLWQQWSPSWQFDDVLLAATLRSFDNPDFVAVAWHSYAHRIGAAPGDPMYDDLERRLLGRPAISVPTIILQGGDASLGSVSGDRFTDLRGALTLPGVGHNPPQENPGAVTKAILELLDAT